MHKYNCNLFISKWLIILSSHYICQIEYCYVVSCLYERVDGVKGGGLNVSKNSVTTLNKATGVK